MPHLVIIRRGQAGAYETLKTEFEHVPNTADVRVMLDRQQGERRETSGGAEIERRHRERRAPVPAAWTSLGVLVVDVEA
jgi:hypothetical protein